METSPLPPRFLSLDVLRGVAILGILLMNIQSFSMPEDAITNPTIYGNFQGINYYAWLSSHLLAEMKFISIFSILFGAGLALQAQRAGADAWKIHTKRMIILLGLGLAHAYLLWDGDILVPYALCGIVVFPLRRLPRWLLLFLGLAAFAVPIVLNAGLSIYPDMAPFPLLRGLNASLRPDFSPYAELATRRGNWRNLFIHRAHASFYFETFIFLIWTFWRCAGCMLIGMALLKLGVLTGQAKRWILVLIGAIGLPLGLAVSAAGVCYNTAHHWNAADFFFPGSTFNYIGSLLTALAYMALIVLLTHWTTATQATRWLRPLEAVGRTALSNYLTQTFICITIFDVLGYYGNVSRSQQLLIVLAIWLVQLLGSTLWLRRFRQGPFEWCWRTLAYGPKKAMNA